MNVRDLPKAELHCHLEACFRPATVMEIGRTLGLDVPQDLAVFRREWLLSRPLANLQLALARFVDIQRIWCTADIIERMTFEACDDAVRQGIRVMEFRYSPDFIAFGKPQLTHERIHRAILRGLERAAAPGLAVGLIGIVQKTLPLDAAKRTVDFIVECADSFVALDFADRDTRPLRDYVSLVDKARNAGLHLTVHAGEEPGPGAALQVREAVEILGAERIGHGIHIDREVMDLLIERNVPLEVCVTSNWLCNSVPSTAAHPVRRLLEAGVPVTINSDDPGLFGIDLCHEYAVLQREHGFGAAEFARCNATAVAHSFVAKDAISESW